MKEVHLSESNFLLSAIQRGDQKAFDALFRRYYPALCAYGHRFVDLEDAEEIVQDSLLWIWENRENLFIETSLSSYLFKMIYRKALNKPLNVPTLDFMKKCRRCYKIRIFIKSKS